MNIFVIVLTIIVSLSLMYILLGNTRKDTVRCPPEPVQMESVPVQTEPVKPEIDNLSEGNMREGFLFWRKPEAPVHNDLLSIS
jgi:hypothetical protein